MSGSTRDARRAGNPAGEERRAEQQHHHRGEGHAVVSTDTIEKGRDHPAQQQGEGDAQPRAQRRQPHPLADHQPHDGPAAGAERHPDADLARPLHHRVRQRGVDAQQREEQRPGREEGEEQGREPALLERRGDGTLERL